MAFFLCLSRSVRLLDVTMGVRVCILTFLVSALWTTIAGFEDFDPHRTPGFNPIEEKRELFESDLEELDRIKNNRGE